LKFLLFGGSFVCANSPRCVFRTFDAAQFVSTSPRKAKQQATLTCSTWACRDGIESMLRLLKKRCALLLHRYWFGSNRNGCSGNFQSFHAVASVGRMSEATSGVWLGPNVGGLMRANAAEAAALMP
jgi:hypothetical protein